MKPKNHQFDENDAPEWYTRGMTTEAMDAAHDDHKAAEGAKEEHAADTQGEAWIAEALKKGKPPF
jgi:hypothetical protein